MADAETAPGVSAHAPGRRGVVFTPAELQYEGLDQVLESVAAKGVNAVALTPGVFLPSDAERGVREPPLDVDGHARVLDRPLWGARVAHVDRYAPYEPDPSIWAGVPYPPSRVAPAEHRTDVARQMIDRSRELGIDPYIILSPTIVPGLPGGHSMSGGTAEVDASERPMPVAGSRSERIIAGQGCPNHPHVQALVEARVKETVQHYPDAAGFFFDWVEYTCYFPVDAFTCFCTHCESAALAAGFDWGAMRHGVRRLWDRLHAITPADLHAVSESGGGLLSLLSADDRAAVELHQRFKAQSVARTYELIREVLRTAGSDISLGASGFPDPWGRITGAALGAAGEYADVVRPKFFTFHWAMMVRWYSEALLSWNTDLPEDLVVRAVLTDFGISGGDRALTPSAFGMPGPEESHPLSARDVVAKIENVTKSLDASTRCEAYLHSYQPAADFDQLLGAVNQLDIAGIWVQRYGYLSDEKLDILAAHWRAAP